MTILRVFPKYPSDCNCYVVIGSRTMLVDTGTGINVDDTIREIDYILSGRPLDMVILTHCHVDHIGGLEKVLDHYGCKAYALPPDSDSIRTADREKTLSEMFGIDINPVPVEDLQEGQVIDMGAHRFTVMHTPGHTPGGLCLYDDLTQSILTGDTLFCPGVGRTDFPSGDYAMLQQSIRSISNIDISGVYPGHGNYSEQQGSDFVRTALKFIGD